MLLQLFWQDFICISPSVRNFVFTGANIENTVFIVIERPPQEPVFSVLSRELQVFLRVH